MLLGCPRWIFEVLHQEYTVRVWKAPDEAFDEERSSQLQNKDMSFRQRLRSVRVYARRTMRRILGLLVQVSFR